jgi:hypothetical protein
VLLLLLLLYVWLQEQEVLDRLRALAEQLAVLHQQERDVDQVCRRCIVCCANEDPARASTGMQQHSSTSLLCWCPAGAGSCIIPVPPPI